MRKLARQIAFLLIYSSDMGETDHQEVLQYYLEDKENLPACITSVVTSLDNATPNDGARLLKYEVEKNSSINYFNCSDGAFVEGAKPLHSSELEEIFDTKEALDKKKVLDFMDQEKTFTIDITAEKLEEMLAKKEYQEAVDVILKFIKNRPTDRIAYVQMLEGVSEILTALSKSRDRNIAFMLDGTTQSMFILANYCLFHRDDPEQGFKLANEILDLYVMYLEDTKKLYEFLPNYVLGPHQALCHGKIGFDHEGHPAPDMPVIYHVVDPEVIANLKYQPFVKNYGDK